MPRRIICTLSIALVGATSTSASDVTFNADIRPILQNKCFACHGPDQKARKGDLRLDTRETALEVLAPQNPERSKLLQRITHSDPDERMPPEETHKTITESEVATLTQWIADGAIYEDHWAFIPPNSPPVPEVAGVGHPIDRFISAQLQSHGWKLSPQADRATLIRRVTLDLTGLPPTPEDVERFENSTDPDAFHRVVDRLLASPAYGEHMAATWLETSRYADTDGYQNDRYRYHWAWRDWVIDAFNQNQPYDQFIVDQLAGDLLPASTLRQQVATAFCRNHRINSEAGSIPEEWQTEYVADRVDMLGTVFLGVTLSCARCHDHKYDPISQKEYYQLFAYFNNVPEFGTGPNNGNSPPFINIPEDWPHAGTAPAIDPAPLEWQKDAKYSGGVRRPKPGDESTLMVMQEMAEPRPTFVLKRGQYNQPDKSEPVRPSVPTRIGGADSRAEATRLGLAQWLTDPQHPLTARVAVNRYWQHFFGHGIVRTSENLGVQGELPSHPGLLDWLACEFIGSGWDVKRIHKSIVLSQAYQQSSVSSPELQELDPDNRLFARASRLRLPAFTIRDQALSASGLLVHQMHGRPAKPYMPPKIWSAISNNKYVQDTGSNLYRRSVYTYWRRTIPPPIMMTLNAGDREVCTVRQARTNTPLQALSLLNNVTFVEAARVLAQRVLARHGDPSTAISTAHRLVTGKTPAAETQQQLESDFDSYLQYYRSQPDAAATLLNTGDAAKNPHLQNADVAAMILVTSTLLNLDQCLTRE